MSQVSVLHCVGRNPLVERGVQPANNNSSNQYDEDVESSAPSSPRSVYPEDETSTVGQSTISQPYLCSSSPLASYPQLRTSAVSELRITDNSHSQSNPSQRKKGGCKLVQLSVHLPSSGESYEVAAKCDVRKSFSNRSFSKYYNRGPYAVIPVTPTGDVVLIVEEAKRGRDGKHFVAMERTCTPPWAVDDKRRHPLLAFAAAAVYKVSVLTRPDAGEAEVEVKCQFAQGSATVSKKRVNVQPAEPRKRPREVKVEVEQENQTDEDEEDDDTPAKDAGKRRRLVSAATSERRNSALSADYTSVVSSPASPFSTTDSSVSSPSYPSSPFTDSTASPSPPCSPLPFTFHIDTLTGYFMADELELKLLPATASVSLSSVPFVASPLLAPVSVWPTYRMSSPGGLVFSPWRSAACFGDVDEFVL